MSLRLIVRQEAERDILEAIKWYEDHEPGVGKEFLVEVNAAINLAYQAPLIHRRLRRQPEVRRILTRRFPYRIFYILSEHAIVVFAILHAFRHDRNWRQRL